MDHVLFSNRMGGRNLLWIGSGFAIAGIFIAVQDRGENLTQTLAIVGGLFVVSILILWLVMKFAMRNQIAELIRHDHGLQAEMIHITGNGEKVRLPLPAPGEWSWSTQRVGKRGNKHAAMLKLTSAGRTFTMPLHGAKVDVAGLRALAPAVIDEIVAGGLLPAA